MQIFKWQPFHPFYSHTKNYSKSPYKSFPFRHCIDLCAESKLTLSETELAVYISSLVFITVSIPFLPQMVGFIDEAKKMSTLNKYKFYN